MSLVRRNPLFLIVLGFLLLVAIQYSISRVFILQGFQQLEIKQTQRDAARVSNAVADKMAQMKITAQDYASWDASYQFIEDGNLAYRTENLSDGVLANLNLDFMVFVNRWGEVAASISIDGDPGSRDQLVRDLSENPSWDLMLRHETTSSFTSGVILMDKAPLMLASLPILTSLAEGPVRGSLIVGRFLDQAELEKLGEQTKIPVYIQRLDKLPLPADAAYAQKTISPQNPVVSKLQDASLLSVYLMARDISDQPAFLFRMELPREINQQGQTTINYILLWTSVSGLLFSAVLYAFVRILNRSREERRYSEQFFQAVFNSINDGIFIHDAQTGAILDANEKVSELFGYTHGEALLLDIQAISSGIPPFTQQDGLNWIEKTVSQGPQHFEWQAKDKSGRLLWVDLNMKLASIAGQKRVLVSIRDVSERKRAEADRIAREIAERASRAKSEFISRMSHELRTPLNAILGFSQLLKMDKLEPEQARDVDYINTSGRHLLNLVNQVLDIAKIESGNFQLATEAIRLETVVKESLELIRPLAEARHVSLGFEAPSRDDLSVLADRQGLRQVLLNLLSNAVKYNREGGEIAVTTSLGMDGNLRLQVRDTGQGIAPEKMERLFVPFDRLDMEAVEQEGTGLGLALSKGLMEAMGGSIGAESSPGVGSTFWLELKMVTENPEVLDDNH